MTIRKFSFIMVIWACLLAVTSLPVLGQDLSYTMAGDSQSVWILRQHSSDKTFDVIAKPGGGKWTWIARSLIGSSSVVSTSEGVLSVFVTPDSSQSPATECLHFSFDNRGGSPAQRVSGSVMAACVVGSGTLVVTLPGQTGSTSATVASQPSQLVLRTSSPEGWQELATVENVTIASDTKVFCCSLEGKVYLLIHGGQGLANRLLCRDDNQWQDVPLRSELQSAEIFGMVSLPQKPGLIIAFSDHKDSQVSRPVSLAILSLANPAGFTIQPVVYQDKQLTLPKTAAMQMARLDKQLMFLWPEGQSLQMASCGGDGLVISQEELSIFKQTPMSLNGPKIIQNFFWVVLILIFVPMILIRPSSPPRPFVLAEGLVRGNLLKRVLAGAIDFLPFNFIAVIVFQMPAMTSEELIAMIRDSQMPDNAAYGLVLALSLYAAYCILMEIRYSSTLGKMIFHLKVIGEGGKSPDMRAVFLRNVMKIAEIIPLGLPLLLLFPLVNRNRQRLGDVLARTAVIDSRSPSRVKPNTSESGDEIPPIPPAE